MGIIQNIFIFRNFISPLQQMKSCIWEYWLNIISEYIYGDFRFFVSVKSRWKEKGGASLQFNHISIRRENIRIDRIGEPLYISSNRFLKWLKHIRSGAIIDIEFPYLLPYNGTENFIYTPTYGIFNRISFILQISSVIYTKIKAMGFCNGNLLWIFPEIKKVFRVINLNNIIYINVSIFI